MRSSNRSNYNEEVEFLKLLPKASDDSALLDFIRRRAEAFFLEASVLFVFSSPLRRKNCKESVGGGEVFLACGGVS